jgi:hypothetical protein
VSLASSLAASAEASSAPELSGAAGGASIAFGASEPPSNAGTVGVSEQPIKRQQARKEVVREGIMARIGKSDKPVSVFLFTPRRRNRKSARRQPVGALDGRCGVVRLAARRGISWCHALRSAMSSDVVAPRAQRPPVAMVGFIGRPIASMMRGASAVVNHGARCAKSCRRDHPAPTHHVRRMRRRGIWRMALLLLCTPYVFTSAKARIDHLRVAASRRGCRL